MIAEVLQHRVFVSYAHEDEASKRQLENHLSPMTRSGAIALWSDREISAGGDWRGAIHEELRKADVVLLLVSAEFLASDYCYDVEATVALARNKAGEAKVIPVILRDCDWQATPLGVLKVLPDDGKPVQLWKDRDSAWQNVVEGIRSALGAAATTESADTRGVQRLEPEYVDGDGGMFARRLRTAYERRKKLLTAGEDTTGADRNIVQLRRRLREQGRLEPGDFLADGRFELTRIIGRGGFATVWLAYDNVAEALVALKVLHIEHSRDATVVERFQRGARSMLNLNHPNVAKVTQPAAREGQWHYFAMQFVRRGDLHTAVMERRLDRAEIVQSIVDAANALHAAHEIGLVHRDVSPSNILLGEHGALLSDFDLVKAPWTTQGTRTGAWMGKIIFGAPEILQGGAADAAERADVYGLAMSAVFAFHGGELPLQTMGNPQAFVERLDESRVLKNVLKAAVEINPEQRTPTILAFRDAFSLATLKKPHEAPYAGNGRILVVDDQRNMRTTLAIILGDAGYEVVEAYDGEHARDAINSDAFDLVITDLRMGGLDGIEVLRHAKAFAPATEVIIMTAFGTIESAVEAILLGARDYIQKPFTEDELLRKVTKVFERSQRSEARAATKSKEPSDLAR